MDAGIVTVIGDFTSIKLSDASQMSTIKDEIEAMEKSK